MNKYCRLIIVFVLIIIAAGLLIACESGPMITEIEVDPATISEEYDITEFEISSVMVILTYENEETESIPLAKTMIKAEDHAKLLVPGDHTITITYKSRTTTFTLRLREGIAGMYKVIFQDEEGEQIGQTQYIEPGGTAVSPSNPTKPDHLFDGWLDQRGNYTFFDNIYEDKVYTATFVPDFCIVKFILSDGRLIEEITIKKGESAESVAPDFPVIAGQTAIGWNRSLDNITEDVTITAVYVAENINVTFVYGDDGRQPRIANFPANSNITPPVSPQVTHSEFLGWYTDESFETERVSFPYLLQNEITFYAKYVSRTQGSPDLEYSYTGASSYTISGYSGDDDVIVIPEKFNNLDVVGVENRAFENVDNLRFYVTDSNNYFSISDGVLFDVNNERLIAYPSGRQSSTYDVPVGVKYIEDYAFANSKNLMVLGFSGDNLLSIGDYAFHNCLNLANINIPVSVETIGNYAFLMEGDSRLGTLTFALNSVLQQIGNGAFSGLNSLTQIILPSSRLESIGDNIFNECLLLRNIEIEEGSNDYFTSINGVLYNSAITTLIAYPANNTINDRAYYVVPDEVEEIKAGAFSYPNIIGVRLPDSITKIEGFAFNSPKLQYIQFMGEQPPQFLSEIQFGDYTPTFIIVPEGARDNYDYFSDFTIIEGSLDYSYSYDSATGYLYTIDTDEKLTLWGARNYLAEMVIPAAIGGYDVKTIGKHTFYKNLVINGVTIPEGVETIDDFAFAKAEKLERVVLPNSLQEIGNNAFENCLSLTEMVYSEDIELYTVGEEIFIETPWYDSEQEEFLLIGNVLFKYNGNGMRAVVPQEVKVIADNAFIDKSNLTNIVLSEDLEIINDYAFFGCSGIFYIEIPQNVIYIGEKAFYECDSLYRIIMKSDIPPQLASSGDIFTSDAIFEYGDKTYDFGILVPYTINQLVLNAYLNHSSWGDYNIFHRNIRQVTFSSAGTQQISVTADTVYEPADPDPRPGYVFAGWYLEDSIDYQRQNDPEIFPIDLEADIPFYARWLNEDEGTEGLQYTLINDGNEYGISGYYGELKYVVIPNVYNDRPVTAILQGAFSSAINATNSEVYEIQLPDSIENIERGALDDTLWYQQFRGDYVLLKDILIEYRGVAKNVVVPEAVNYIVSGAFKNNNFIRSITFSSSIEILPEEVVYNCNNLESVVLPETLIEIKDKAFMNCQSLENIEFPTGLYTVAPDAFENTLWLNSYIDDVVIINGILYKYKGKEQTLHIPNTIVKIEKRAFFNNIFLRDVYIPVTVENIGESAFEGCSSMEYVKVADNSLLRRIGERAFYGCHIMQDFNMGNNSRIDYIGDYAFAYCLSLLYVNFPATIEYLGEGAYRDCGITYARFANQSNLESIERDTFANCRNLKTVSFGESTSLQIIKEGAFANCKNLISVVVPESNILLTEILESSFENCTSLVNVTLPSSLMEIGDDAFTGTPYLESNIQELMTIGSVLMKYTGTDSIVHISSDIAAISKGAFKDNQHIREIIIEEGSQLFAIGEEAFMNCTNLESVNFPSTITYIGKDAMYNTAWINNYLDDFVVINNILIKYKGDDYQAIIPNSVSVIGIEAFAENTKLRNIEIGSSVTRIMARAFNNMSEESSITMLRTAPPQLAEDIDIVSVVYVQSNAVFNNYREDPSWVRFVNDPSESIIVKYEIEFDLAYEDATMEFLSLETNALYTEPVPVFEGYTFIGWYEYYDSSLLPQDPGAYDILVSMPYIPEENITLYAKWIHNNTGTIAGELRIQHFEPDGFEEGTYLVEYTSFDRHVMIPSRHSAQQIIGVSKYSNGSTEYSGFANNEYIEEISFVEGYYDDETFVQGSTIKYILEGAFENATNLRRIVLPSSLEYIGPNAFKNCSNLEEIIFTATTGSVEIAENAFYGCSSLTTITLPENITVIGDNAFSGCSSLMTIYMDGDTPPTSNQPFEINQGMRIYVKRSVDDMIVETYKSEWPLYEDYIYPKP